MLNTPRVILRLAEESENLDEIKVFLPKTSLRLADPSLRSG